MSGLKTLSTCELCLETITNPLCASCLSSSVNTWIKKEGDELFLDYLKKSHEFFEFLSESEDNVEFCITCKEDTKKVLCVQCYTDSVYKILESVNWIKAEKFKILFGFGSDGPKSYDNYEVI